jgi:ribonucleotide reductase beta subunit family protein with ferritin-like domain
MCLTTWHAYLPLYKKAEASFWTVEEMYLSNNTQDWNNRLNDNEYYSILTYIKGTAKQEDLFKTIETIPCIKWNGL